MKTGIEDFLQKIDASFKGKGQNEIYMTYFMVFGVFFAFSYLLFWESAEAEYIEQKAAVEKKIVDIASDNNYMTTNPPAKIARLNKAIAKAKADTISYHDNNVYIKDKIESIPELIYDEVAWGRYLHSISINAKKYKIKILNFTNTYAKVENSFGHFLDIELETSSSYKNVLRFVNAVEKSDLVVDLHTFNIESSTKANEAKKSGYKGKKALGNFSISVWGVKY